MKTAEMMARLIRDDLLVMKKIYKTNFIKEKKGTGVTPDGERVHFV